MTEKYLNFVKNMNAYSRNSVKPKVCQKKKKSDDLDFIYIKNINSSKDTIMKIKAKTRIRRKYFIYMYIYNN